MTDFVGAEKPSLDELSHYGVKGMKWGQHKKYSTEEIHNARARQLSRAHQLNDKAAKLNLATGAKKDKLAKDYAKAFKELQNNPDRTVGGRMTRGEKAAALILGGPFGAIAIGINKAQVSRIEKQQGRR